MEERWESPDFQRDEGTVTLPDIGHAKAQHLPDTSQVHWRFDYAEDNDIPLRDRKNWDIFYEASQAVYQILQNAPHRSEEAQSWEHDLAPLLGVWFWENPPNREAFLESFYPNEFTFTYDRHEWRTEALQGDSVEWDDFAEPSDFAGLSFTYGGDPRWFYFHAAAHRQRQFILDRIPASW